MNHSNTYGTFGLANKVALSQRCPLGKSTFLSKEAVFRQCTNYRKYGMYIGGTNVNCECCDVCMNPEKGIIPNNVTVKS
jgi:hypothetical protein